MLDFLLDRTVVASLIFLIGGIVWWQTGRSPMVWIAIGMLHLEATRLQLIASARVAARHFWDNYLSQYETVRTQHLQGD
jgi:hypothetical protein